MWLTDLLTDKRTDKRVAGGQYCYGPLNLVKEENVIRNENSKMSKKSHHFLMLWPWPLTYDHEKVIRSGHYHYQCVYQIWEQSIPWFLSYRVNTIAGGGRLRRKTITSPDPSDTGDIKICAFVQWPAFLNICVIHLGITFTSFSSMAISFWSKYKTWGHLPLLPLFRIKVNRQQKCKLIFSSCICTTVLAADNIITLHVCGGVSNHQK